MVKTRDPQAGVDSRVEEDPALEDDIIASETSCSERKAVLYPWTIAVPEDATAASIHMIDSMLPARRRQRCRPPDLTRPKRSTEQCSRITSRRCISPRDRGR